MKNVILFLLFAIQACFSQSGWVRQSPLPTTNSLTTIKFINNNTGFISGYRTIIKTTNKGVLWQPVYTEYLNYVIYHVDFIDENTGIAAVLHNSGAQTGDIVKTTNAGENWTMIWINTNKYLYSLDCTNNNTVYVSGLNGAFYKSTNSGDNWISMNLDSNKDLYSVYFLNNNTGFLLCRILYSGYYVLRTTNGGITWQQQVIESQYYSYANRFFFLNDSLGFIVGFNKVLKTTNMGENWSVLNYQSNDELGSICFKDVNTGYLVGNNGKIILTTNGGINWNVQNADLVEGLGAVVINEDGSVFSSGSNGMIIRSTNLGLNWSQQFSGSSFTLNSISFSDINTGYALGSSLINGGYRDLIKTTNGGINWLFKKIPVSALWSVCYFLNSNLGFIAGENGNLYKTTNGGDNWINYTMYGNNFKAIDFIDDNTGFLSGPIYKTTNAGINWVQKSTYRGRAIDFINSNTGYSLGFDNFNQIIIKSTDAGETWFMQSISLLENQEIYSINFINENTGFVSGGGNYGFIMKTVNGGYNWYIVHNDNSYVYDIFMTNSLTGYAVGGDLGSLILKTTNSGNNWVNINNINFSGLNSLFFINDTIGYACGKGGTILKTTNGGELIGIKPIYNFIPSNFLLHQNYPNPFNPKTIINYQLPINNFVKLTIYDVMGREITVLVNQKQNAGTYEVEWNASDFASGVYFYSLQVGNMMVTKKMILLK